MRTGKLAISRGHQIDAPHLALVPRERSEAAHAAVHAPPASSEYHAVHDRLTALERLTRLHELGALSPEEFAAEKLVILGLPADELLLTDPAPVHFVPAVPRRGPSLLGRMLSWKFLLLSLTLGLGFSLVAQPNATMRFFDQTLRAIGL